MQLCSTQFYKLNDINFIIFGLADDLWWILQDQYIFCLFTGFSEDHRHVSYVNWLAEADEVLMRAMTRRWPGFAMRQHVICQYLFENRSNLTHPFEIWWSRWLALDRQRRWRPLRWRQIEIGLRRQSGEILGAVKDGRRRGDGGEPFRVNGGIVRFPVRWQDTDGVARLRWGAGDEIWAQGWPARWEKGQIKVARQG
jgi:hypothetical protein